MAFKLPPDFIDQVRQIRGTSIISKDYDCPLKDKHKVQSTIMNAFGAQLQNAAYKEGIKNFAIFSLAWSTPVRRSHTWIHGCLWVNCESCPCCSTCSASNAAKLFQR